MADKIPLLLDTSTGMIKQFTAGDTIAYTTAPGGGVRVLWDAYTDAGNSGTSETDLYSYTIPADTLAADGTKLIAKYGLALLDTTPTFNVRVYFAGTLICDVTFGNVSGGNTAVTVDALLIRTGSATLRAIVSIMLPRTTYTYAKQTDLSGLSFTGTNVLKIAGTVTSTGAGSNDLVAKEGTIMWYPPA